MTRPKSLTIQRVKAGQWSVHVLINYPLNESRECFVGATSNRDEVLEWIESLIVEEPDATSMVITIARASERITKS